MGNIHYGKITAQDAMGALNRCARYAGLDSALRGASCYSLCLNFSHHRDLTSSCGPWRLAVLPAYS